MALPMPVAVLDGDIYPLDNFSVDVEGSKPIFSIDGTAKERVVTEKMISGVLRSYRQYNRERLGELETVYLFPMEDGTEERVVLSGVHIPSVPLPDTSNTQKIEFVARDILYDGQV